MLLTILILFLIIFILIIPVDIVFVVNNRENQKNSISVNLFLGLVYFNLFPKKQTVKTKPLKIEPRKKKKSLTLRKILKISKNEKFIGKLAEFIKKVLRSIKLKLDKLYIRLGLDDPADTGMLWGLLGPASALLYYYSKNNVLIEPEFQDSALDIDTKGNLSIIPLEILFISLIFLLSPTTVKTLWLNFAGGAE